MKAFRISTFFMVVVAAVLVMAPGSANAEFALIFDDHANRLTGQVARGLGVDVGTAS